MKDEILKELMQDAGNKGYKARFQVSGKNKSHWINAGEDSVFALQNLLYVKTHQLLYGEKVKPREIPDNKDSIHYNYQVFHGGQGDNCIVTFDGPSNDHSRIRWTFELSKIEDIFELNQALNLYSRSISNGLGFTYFLGEK